MIITLKNRLGIDSLFIEVYFKQVSSLYELIFTV